MSTAAPTRSHQLAHDDIELLFRADNAHQIADLIHKWGLSRDERRHAYPDHDIRLDFDGFDRAHTHRTVADVWTAGLNRP